MWCCWCCWCLRQKEMVSSGGSLTSQMPSCRVEVWLKRKQKSMQAMIDLKDYDPAQFDRFKSNSAAEYALDLMRNHGLDEQAAQQKAWAGIDAAFPDKVNTATNKLLSIVKKDGDTDCYIGHLWYSLTDETSAFIMDFYILPGHRGAGYASHALSEFKTRLKADGLSKISLRVEPDNPAALKTYERAGFFVTGWNMVKKL